MADTRSGGSDAVIVAKGLVKRFGDVVALDGIDLEVEPGTVFGLLGPNGAGKTTTVRILTTILRARRRPGQRPRDRRGPRPAGRARADRAGRPVRGGRREPDRAARTCAWSVSSPTCPKAIDVRRGRRAARTIRPHPRGRPTGPHVLRWHATPARPRRRARPPAAGAVPRRADDRARPAQPQRPVGGHRGARGRRHHGAAHHAVPRGGRPPGRSHRGHRRRPEDRRGHRVRAEGDDGRHHRRDHDGRPRRRLPGPPETGNRSARSKPITTDGRSG